MSKTQQKIITTASIAKDGNVAISIDFFPKMPTMEEYNHSSEAKQACVAIANKLAVLTREFIKEMENFSEKATNASTGN